MALLRSTQYVLGDQTTRKTLESTYTAGNISTGFKTGNAVQGFVDIEYTAGAAETLNSIQVKFEFSDSIVGSADVQNHIPAAASTEWYQETTEAVSAGTITETLAERTFAQVSAAATYDRFRIALPLGHGYTRISIKETGVAANKGSASVKVTMIEQESIN